MIFEMNYETKEDLYCRVVIKCGISNLINAFYKMLDGYAKDENGNIPDYDGLDHELMYGEDRSLKIAIASVTGSSVWGKSEFTLTEDQIKKVALLAEKISTLADGAMNKS